MVAAVPAFPPPATLLHLALRRLDTGEAPVEPGSVVPLYMRDADARANFERAERVGQTLRIEKLKRRDLRKLLPIENIVFPEPWSPQVFNSELAMRRAVSTGPPGTATSWRGTSGSSWSTRRRT